MLVGEYTHNLDQKGRVAIPAKFRQFLSRGAVVTRGLDRCLFLYPKEEWTKLAERLTKLPISQTDSRAFSRFLLAGAMDVELDSQGRIILPGYLRQYAGISKKVVLAGLYNRIEIWDAQTWEKFKETTEKESTDIAEKLRELGI